MINDYSLTYYIGGGSSWHAQTEIHNEDHSFAITNQLSSGCIINHRLPWRQDNLRLYESNEYGSGGYWKNWDRGYLALKMIYEEDTLYGYIDMQLVFGIAVKIYGYAYFDPSSLNISEISQFVNIYPNPTSGFTKISVNDKIRSIAVYDITGKLIESRVYNNPETSLYYDFNEYKNGLYFLKITNKNNQIFTSKIVVR